MKKLFMITLGILIILPLSFSQAGAAENIKSAGKKVAREFKEIGIQTGRTGKEAGKAIGKGFRKAGIETGKAFKKAGKEVGKSFRK